MAGEITKRIIDKADSVLVEVYKDAVSPMVKPVGEILGFLPRTLKLALSGWEKWLINGEETIRLTAESVREKIQALPEEKLVEPESYVAIPAMQQLSYCVNNEELRELYANLLVSSMNVDKKWQVHPAFVDIIKQLTPDEAKFIKSLKPDMYTIHPLIDVRMEMANKGGVTIISNFTTTGIDELEHPEYICRYIDNLIRLSIIVIPPNSRMIHMPKYDPLITHPILTESIPKDKPNDLIVRYEYKCFNLTSFGLNFINICCK